MTAGAPARLRGLLAGPEPVVAPGAYDALSALLAEQAGFGAVYMTGFGASASLLGRPDLGLLSTPLLFNALEGGRTPPIELERLRELGFRLVLAPLTALLAATRAVQDALAGMRADPAPARPGALAFSAFTDVVGLPEMRRIEKRFTPVAPQP